MKSSLNIGKLPIIGYLSMCLKWLYISEHKEIPVLLKLAFLEQPPNSLNILKSRKIWKSLRWNDSSRNFLNKKSNLADVIQYDLHGLQALKNLGREKHFCMNKMRFLGYSIPKCFKTTVQGLRRKFDLNSDLHL